MTIFAFGSHTIPQCYLGKNIFYKLLYFYVKSPESIENFQHVKVDPEMSWCKSEKLYGQGAEHDLVKHYPVNDGRDQLVIHNSKG